MDRRTFLTIAVGGMVAGAGCLSGSEEPQSPESGEPQPSGSEGPQPPDGYAPDGVLPDDRPEAMEVDTGAFDRIRVEGQEVPLAPIAATHNWYLRRDARFADARGEGQYTTAHIAGAAWSPAPDGREDDPALGWPETDRIVLYCGCPHHLSSLRAASLLSAGYTDIYVIDEGFYEWRDRGFPLSGDRIEQTNVMRQVIRGRSDSRYAGEPVYATHEATAQREAAFIDADGYYEVVLRFTDVTQDSEIWIDAPDYTVSAALTDLTTGVVTPPQ